MNILSKQLCSIRKIISFVFLNGFTQLEKLINNFFVVKVGRINKKIFYLQKKNSNIFLTGFTLIELLIAISVFMIGIMGAFSLSLNNLNTAKENSQRVIAANLAREGLELVRNIRDSNWLAREANVDSDSNTFEIDIYEWDHGFDDSNFRVDYFTGLMPFSTPAPADLNSAIGNSQATLLLSGGYYGHQIGQPTTFSRAINLRAICLDKTDLLVPIETVELSLDCPVLANIVKIGFQVTSRVRYTYGTKTNTIDAVENIYNWRQ
ncbi:MAG: hypothetical protein QG642_208 [Patescibacteria group bacterium]|nr:hypothetical protein [Patescibacteria group bacterium]